MNPYISLGAGEEDGRLQVLWEDGERALCRGWRVDEKNARHSVLTVRLTAEHPAPASIDRLTHEYGLKENLEGAWAVRPLELVRERGRTMLVLDDPGTEPLDRYLSGPMEVRQFLRLAINIAAALGQVHQNGLVHKDLKPAHILVNGADGQVRLTGFGLASRLPRERQPLGPPEFIAGTLAYMAPEQTGRMNRSIDSRSDLYALGVTFYQMLTGVLPFAASDPMEWVHCHVARTPVQPHERVGSIPGQISHIVTKLLAKTAEERYQTAAGVERDLRRCLAEWQAKGRIDEFPLGAYDLPDQLMIPEKLYGRAREVDTLLASFDRVVASGKPELVIVSGYSGIGKSSVVNELHKVLVPPRGFFASGKFDQYKRDVPCATIAQAFQRLVRTLLGKPEAELCKWRDEIREALRSNGALIVDLVPELKFIIGEQLPVPDLPPQDAKARFQLVFRRFINVFARPEHPLALFLDDLQWLDSATLDVVEDLLTQPDVRHLMIVGAYRDNEVTPSHPLMRTLDAIRQGGATVRESVLAPLTREDVTQLVADCLRCCEPGQVAPLAQLIHEKTAGNPFFAIQFISALAEEALLSFDHEKGQWRWDLNRIRAKGYTDNVVELMVGRLVRLPIATQKALERLACIGSGVDVTTLSVAYEASEQEVAADLWEALRAELIARSNGTYRFAHDRVHEAAYSLIPEEIRPAVHLGIGRRLAASLSPDKRDEAIFEIVSQFNRGAALITSVEEREQVAEFDLIAGKRAQASTAYASALNYLATGAALLAEDSWQRRHDLAFALEMARAQCEFVSGAVANAEERLSALSNRAATTVEKTSVACLRVDLYMSIDRSDHAVTVGLEALRRLGIDWPSRPTEAEAQREYEGIWSRLGDRTIESLVESPLMGDPISLATLDLLIRVAVPAFFASSHLFAVAVCRAISLSLERGNSDASCIAYELFAMLAGPHFGNYAAGYRFGRLGCQLVERPELKRFEARTYETFGFVIPWTKHVRNGRDLLVRSLDIANQIGDITYSGYAYGQITTNFLMAGDPLLEAQKEAENGLAFAQRVQFGLIVGWITGQLRLIRMLRGLTRSFGSFDEAGFDELEFERHLASNAALALPECWYWIRKLQAYFFAGDYAGAIHASAKAQPMLWTSLSLLEMAEFHFYDALTLAAAYEAAPTDERQTYLEKLSAHRQKLEIWAQNCPENFENRAALVKAEIARVEGHELAAERLYERAIESAQANGFVHNEALANELAARFYRTRGFEKIANTYLRDARRCYARWGADGKVRQLELLYPNLNDERTSSDPAGTIVAPIEHLDFATVIKVSQAISGEIVKENLIDTLMRTAIECAGAERGLLILPQDDAYRIEAEATTGSRAVIVALRQAALVSADLPESVFQYVQRTKESILLHDASAENPFSADEYLRRHHVRSMLCLPLLSQTRLLGVLYLENNLAAHVFTPARMTVLKLLASEAAISLENTRLYSDLREREARVRRLVDANIIGIFIWDLNGRIVEANDAFLGLVGYDREDLAAGRLRWTDLTPPEWRDRDERQWVPELKQTGSLQPFEKEYFRKDGSRVPVLIGAAGFEEGGNQGVAFVLDLRERRQAEAKARESERRYLEVQMEMAHANRVATMGQLSASIGHEINQPLSGVVTSAETALLWLDREPVNIMEVRRALERVVRDGKRVSNVISRIRALIKKAPPQKDELDINEAILEVVGLTHGEAAKNGILIQTQLEEDLPAIQGDRVQLQQVVLNLTMNAVEAMCVLDGGPRELLITAAKAEPDGIVVAVRDSGPGVDKDHFERIFSAFYTTKSEGLGMGLSICRSIIDAHGGRLWATANTPRGAVFQFRLPSKAGAPSPAPPAGAHA